MFGSPGAVPGVSFTVSPGYVFDGLTIATPAPLLIGSSTLAQPELNVPTIPSIAGSAAYAFASAAHFAVSYPPVAAVESSHDWKPTEYFPAFQFCCARMNWTALAISVVRVLLAPWSGSAVPMMYCGLPLPLY